MATEIACSFVTYKGCDSHHQTKKKEGKWIFHWNLMIKLSCSNKICFFYLKNNKMKVL